MKVGNHDRPVEYHSQNLLLVELLQEEKQLAGGRERDGAAANE